MTEDLRIRRSDIWRYWTTAGALSLMGIAFGFGIAKGNLTNEMRNINNRLSRIEIWMERYDDLARQQLKVITQNTAIIMQNDKRIDHIERVMK
jgi:hypothetical protein